MTSPQVLDVGEGADAQRLGVTAHSIEVPCGVESHCADGLDILQRRHRNKPGLASAASLQNREWEHQWITDQDEQTLICLFV